MENILQFAIEVLTSNLNRLISSSTFNINLIILFSLVNRFYVLSRDPFFILLFILSEEYYSWRHGGRIILFLKCQLLLLTLPLAPHLRRPSCMLLLPALRSLLLSGFQPVILRILPQNRFSVDSSLFILHSVCFCLS